MTYQIPYDLREKRRSLAVDIVPILRAGGKLAEAGAAFMESAYPHFRHEDSYALPPLGLLPFLPHTIDPETRRIVLAMTDQLQETMPQMKAEHVVMVARLEDIAAAAREAEQPKHVRFAQGVIAHIEDEEENIYPASLLVGEMLRNQS